MKYWPITLRIGLEFDSADIQKPWWHPWFHTWGNDDEYFSRGFRIGIFGLHLVIGIAIFGEHKD